MEGAGGAPPGRRCRRITREGRRRRYYGKGIYNARYLGGGV
jgi:hypothetical protein